jgi:hypothetical protein
MLPQDVLPTLCRSVYTFGAVNNGSLAFSIHNKRNTTHMSEKRQWDESRSPQWRYLLSRESAERRTKEKRAEQAEGDLRRGVSKRKRLAQERRTEKRKLKNKSGREILYSASPGGENSRYYNTEFVSRKKTPENDETQ